MKATSPRTANSIFKNEYGNSKNFMTPYVIERGMLTKNIAYELSYGEGLFDQKIYGITFVYSDAVNCNTVRLHNHSQCCESMSEAKKIMKETKQNESEVLETYNL